MEEIPEPDPLPDPPKTDPNKEFTQAELSTYDFTGWDWGKLPYGVVKAARNGGHSIVTARIECVECKRPMWSCHPKLEDLCEEDDYLLRVRNWDLVADRAKRNNLKPVNPWAESEEIPRFFWPKDET